MFLYDQSINQLLTRPMFNTDTKICGWVKTIRQSKNIAFIALNDGSCQEDLQIVVDINNQKLKVFVDQIATGASLAVLGLIKESNGGKQKLEILAESIEILGLAPSNYPLQKKQHSFEFLREIAHLRGRTNTFAAMNRVRSQLSYSIHTYFMEREFVYIHTPIITANDGEGAGAMFRVSTAENGKQYEDPSNDFFSQETYLTVSGQLAVETQSIGLGKVYSFGPTFRAENSQTARHAAEFWMIEPEMAFCDLDGLMMISEDFIKYLIQEIQKKCASELEFFNQWVHKGLKEELDRIVEQPFKHITYTEAIEYLQTSSKSFEFPVSWGVDLAYEHEKYLCEEVFQCPLIVTDYPQDIKAFYMKQNNGGKTVRAMDILFPRIGEIIGGSEREENLETLLASLKKHNLDEKDYEWYLDLRRFGSVPHSGFGLGLERLLMFVTGLSNIRDVIPFPRTPKNCLF